MKWIKKLFFGNAKASPSDDDRISNFSVDEEGNISAIVTLSVNGEKLEFPIDTNEQKLAEEAKAKEANKANPNSCEREPAEDEIKVPISFLTPENIALSNNGPNLFSIYLRAKRLGYNNIAIKKDVYKEAFNSIVKNRRLNYSIQRTASLNMLGIAYEKKGEIEAAIQVYEENIAMRSNGRHSYDRLKTKYGFYERLLAYLGKARNITNACLNYYPNQINPHDTRNGPISVYLLCRVPAYTLRN